MDTKHVMISYNWSHKDRAMEIADLLKKHGKKVWMDVQGGIQQGDVNKSMAAGTSKLNQGNLLCQQMRKIKIMIF